jgi:hypothetical protein
MVRLAHTVHLSCSDTNIVSKRTETRFHITHITKKCRQVCPIWFLSLWYILCIRAPIFRQVTLSPNGPKWASTWASSPSSTIRCVQNDFWAYGTFSTTVHLSCTDANILSKQTLTLSPDGSKRDSTRPMSARSSIRGVQKDLWAYGTFGTNRAPILHLN